MGTSRKFATALSYAARVHANQVRKVSGEPYIAHLMHVSALVMESGGSETQAIAALLHDAVEDQPIETLNGPVSRLGEIWAAFGPEVAELVEACSDSNGVPPKAPWVARKLAFIGSIASVPEAALPIIAADKIHNAQSVLDEYAEHGDAVFENFKEGHYATVWYYTSVWMALNHRGEFFVHPLSVRLGELVERLYATLDEVGQARLDLGTLPS